MKAQGIPVVSLAAGEPDFDTPAPIKRAAIRAIQAGFTKYTEVAGIPELRAAIAQSLKRTMGVAYEPDQVVVTSGAKQALFNALQVLVGPGDEVIVPSPYWVSYPPMVRLAGASPVIVKVPEKEGFLLTPDLLRRAITPKTRVVILNSPCNPTGAVYERERLSALGRIIQEHRLILLSDEIYSRLTYGVDHVSPASLSRAMMERTVVVDGLSKAYAMTGWRLGFAAGPLDIIKAMIALQSHSTSNVASVVQKAAVTAVSGSQRSVERMRQEFERRRDFVVEQIRGMRTWSCHVPNGAFYAFINIRRTGLTSTAVCEKLLEEGRVALIPGVEFGAEGYVRLSYAASLATLTKAMAAIRRVFP